MRIAKKKERSRHSRAPHTATEGHSAAAASTQPTTPSILISEERFRLGFDVALSDPIDGYAHGREFQDYQMALAYARVLRLEFWVPIVDRTGGPL